MAEKLVSWSLQNRFFVLVLGILLVVAGLDHLSRLPIDAVPDVTNVQVQVLTTAPALAPLEVERFITSPMSSTLWRRPSPRMTICSRFRSR